jgi:hypothetical protein
MPITSKSLSTSVHGCCCQAYCWATSVIKQSKRPILKWSCATTPRGAVPAQDHFKNIFELRDRVPSYGSAHELFYAMSTSRLSQKRSRGSPERTDEGYGDLLHAALGLSQLKCYVFSWFRKIRNLKFDKDSIFEMPVYKTSSCKRGVRVRLRMLNLLGLTSCRLDGYSLSSNYLT